MNFKGKYETIIETTMGRFMSGGILVGDIVKIKKNALKHPKIKEMSDNLKAQIQALADTDLHLSVTAVNSIRPSQGDMGDGLGLGSTTAPTDFWVSIAVLHSPGFKGNPVTLPIEVLELQDFGASLPPVPDSLVRKGNVNIKPVELDNLLATKNTTLKHSKGAISEAIEDVYGNMGNQEQNVTVRLPMEDSEDFKANLDTYGITYSLVGPNRFELHGKMSDIQTVIQKASLESTPEIEIEVIQPQEPAPCNAPHAIPTDTGINPAKVDGEEEDEKRKTEDEGIEEAFNNVGTSTTKLYQLDDDTGIEEAFDNVGIKVRGYSIVVANAFADNVTTYLASENIDHSTGVDGTRTVFGIRSTAKADDILSDLRQNVMGDLTYLKVVDSVN